MAQAVRKGSGDVARGAGLRKGSMLWCEAVVLHTLAEVVSGRMAVLDNAARSHLHFWPHHLAMSPPRTITVGDQRPPVLLYTDGMEEEEGGETIVGVIGVVVDDSGIGCEAFGGSMRR